MEGGGWDRMSCMMHRDAPSEASTLFKNVQLATPEPIRSDSFAARLPPPEAMHGACDGFGGSDGDDFKDADPYRQPPPAPPPIKVPGPGRPGFGIEDELDLFDGVFG
jgi:hypothetical protein